MNDEKRTEQKYHHIPVAGTKLLDTAEDKT